MKYDEMRITPPQKGPAVARVLVVQNPTANAEQALPVPVANPSQSKRKQAALSAAKKPPQAPEANVSFLGNMKHL